MSKPTKSVSTTKPTGAVPAGRVPRISAPAGKRGDRTSAASSAPPSPAKPAAAAGTVNGTTVGVKKKQDRQSKQSRVIAMLQSPAGATLAAVMQATGWQQHSVRGFFAGVVRKRLKLKLTSKKVDGERVYRTAGLEQVKPAGRKSQRQSS